MIKILLLEDDSLFAESLMDFLEDYEFDIELATNGEVFLQKAYEEHYHLYLLDINVPLLNGIETLKELRATKDNTPAIYLTSYKDKETLKECFTTGCDDYLTKPFDMDELLLRINSLLKRSNILTDNLIQVDDITFDKKANTFSKNNTLLESSLKVAELFLLCYENNQKIVTKEMIIDRLWGYGQEYSEGSIRVYMSKLQKIFSKEQINNIKNVGYKIEFKI
jgi:DNA-binding response OmpR family regulator